MSTESKEAQMTAVEAEQTSTEESETVEIDHSPPRLSSGITVGAVVVGLGLFAPFNLIAALFSLGSGTLVATSLFVRESRGALSAGVALGLFGALVAGAYGSVPPVFLSTGVSALFLGWAVGQNAISIGDQLGKNTKTRRLELVYLGTTALAIAIINIIVLIIFGLVGSGRPEPAVAIIVVGSIILLWALGD